MEKKKNILSNVRQAILVTILLMVICGFLFPLVLSGLSRVIFPEQAKGSLIEENGTVIGSEFVGQEFTQPYFMKGRPSAVHYNTYTEDENGNKMYSDGSEFGGVASGSSNYGPSNPELVNRVESDMAAFLEANPDVKKEDIPTDLLTASGSGLDPHISVESANIQIPAVAEASGIQEERLKEIVKENTTGKLIGIFGEETVNVLGVNVSIAKEMGII